MDSPSERGDKAFVFPPVVDHQHDLLRYAGALGHACVQPDYFCHVEDEVEAGRYGIQVHHVFSGDQSHRHFLLFSGTGDEDLRNGDADSASVWTLHADKRAAVL